MKRPVALLTGPRRAALSGVSTHVNLLMDSGLRRSFDLLHFEVGREGRDEGPLRRMGRLLASPFRLAWKVLVNRAALVHVNSVLTVRGYWRDLMYVIVARLCRSRVLYQVHGGPLPQAFCRGNRLATAFVRATLGLADVIVVLSDAERDAFRRFGVAPPVLTFPNGIDCRHYATLSRERSEPHRTLRLLYLGRMVREKGLFELLEAMELARGQNVAAELVLAGDGPATGCLRSTAAAHGLQGLSFVGPVSGQGKAQLLEWADALVLPSYAEGLPYALLEAMAAGVPAIAARVGAIPEVVADGTNGLLIEPRSAPALAMAICRVAHDRAALARMSQASRSTVAARYSIDRLAVQLGHVYTRLCARRIDRYVAGV
ncbi:MAG TPA: glycosyltransferase family 4 protein [Steroidobacteraceae bacterium]|nr:glycosyltransferase family 4 protein [Steroidobacteraceae bacterium]